jgi:hypothetical protein
VAKSIAELNWFTDKQSAMINRTWSRPSGNTCLQPTIK